MKKWKVAIDASKLAEDYYIDIYLLKQKSSSENINHI